MFKNKKSQVAVTDMFIALFISTILIIVIVFAWNRYTVILGDNVEYTEMQIIAFQVSDLLVKTKGEPEDWENSPDNVDVIGLTSSDRELSKEKVNAFINLSYSITSKSLGTELYSHYFQLKSINGTKLAEHGAGFPRNRSVVNVQRIVRYENEEAVVEFAIWK